MHKEYVTKLIANRLDGIRRTSAAQHHLKNADSSLALWGINVSQRLRKTGIYVALARKLAVTMLAIWKSGERYEPYYGTSAKKPELDKM